ADAGLRDGAGGGREGLPLDPPAHDPPGPDAEHFGIEARQNLVAASVQHRRLAADLDPTRPPRVDRGQVVDDKGDPGVVAYVAVLLTGGEAVAADVDGVKLWVVAEAHRHDVWLPIRANRSQPAQPLAAQVGDLGRGKGAHGVVLVVALLIDSRGVSSRARPGHIGWRGRSASASQDREGPCPDGQGPRASG